MKRTRCIFIVLCFIAVVQQLNGQNTFQLQFFHPADDYPITTIEDKFGNFVSAGQQIVQPFMQNGKIWIIKANGDTASRVFHFSDTASFFHTIEINEDETYTVFGTQKLPPDFSKAILLALKVDTLLNIVETHNPLIPAFDEIYVESSLKTSDAYYLCCDSKDTNGIVKPLILKLNNELELVDSSTYKIPGDYYDNYFGQFNDVIISPDSSQLYCFVRHFQYDDSICSLFIVDTALIFVSIKPFPVNQYPYTGMSHYDNGLTGRFITDSTFIVGGKYEIYDPGDPHDVEIALTVMDTTMEYTGVTLFGSPDTNNYAGYFQCLDFRNPDSIYFAGTKNFIPYPFPQDVSWIQTGQVDSQLNTKYEKFYGGDAHYKVTSIIATSDGGSLVTAYKYDHNVQYYEHDIFFLKLNNVGCITNSRYTVPEEKKQFLIYPNPSDQGGFNIRSETRNSTISLSDINGKIILISNLKAGDNYLHTNHLKSGLYIALISDEQGINYHFKIIIL